MNEEKVKNKSQSKSKEDQGPRISINNTLYLNTSSNFQSNNIENGGTLNNVNGSFDIKGDLDSVNNKKAANNNLSFLHSSSNNNNNRPNTENNQFEMEDILLKMVLEEGDQKKPQENPNILVENTNYLGNRLNTSFENNRKKQSNSVYQPSKNDDSKHKKDENNKTNTSFQQNSSFVNESRMDKTFNTICCLHEEELRKAKQKIDHLSKKMKLIIEENKVRTKINYGLTLSIICFRS